MKINKKNPRHWLLLLQSTAIVLLTIPIRIFTKKDNRIVLYGHKLQGNIKAIYDKAPSRCCFITLDPEYFEKNKKDGTNTQLITKPQCLNELCKTQTIISDHGLHTLNILKKTTNIKFIDVWHGIPFIPQKLMQFKHYKQVWVASKSMKEKYLQRGLKEDQVIVTGYGRTDALVNKIWRVNKLKKKYHIKDKFKKIVLFAPTWKQNDKSRNILGFAIDTKSFFKTLNQTLKKHDSLLIFRTHLNSPEKFNLKLSNIKFMPYSKFPLAEEFLYIADILISDWSSITFDYLVLKRPTIYIDTKFPGKNGYFYSKTNRFGKIVSDFQDLNQQISNYITKPESFTKEFKSKMKKVHNHVYDTHADGKATERYYKELNKILK